MIHEDLCGPSGTLTGTSRQLQDHAGPYGWWWQEVSRALMSFHVKRQMIWSWKTPLTLSTLEGFDTSVLAMMPRQFVWSGEPPLAAFPRASIRFLAWKIWKKKHISIWNSNTSRRKNQYSRTIVSLPRPSLIFIPFMLAIYILSSAWYWFLHSTRTTMYNSRPLCCCWNTLLVIPYSPIASSSYRNSILYNSQLIKPIKIDSSRSKLPPLKLFWTKNIVDSEGLFRFGTL